MSGRRELVTKLATMLMACVGAAGCSTSSGPKPAQFGTYILRSVAGIALPAPYFEAPVQTTLMVADTLRLRDDGTGSSVQVVSETGGTPFRADNTLKWSDASGTLNISFDCPPGASCIESPHMVGTFTAAGITISQSRITLSPLVYDRVARGQ